MLPQILRRIHCLLFNRKLRHFIRCAADVPAVQAAINSDTRNQFKHEVVVARNFGGLDLSRMRNVHHVVLAYFWGMFILWGSKSVQIERTWGAQELRVTTDAGVAARYHGKTPCDLSSMKGVNSVVVRDSPHTWAHWVALKLTGGNLFVKVFGKPTKIVAPFLKHNYRSTTGYEPIWVVRKCRIKCRNKSLYRKRESR